LSPLPAFDATFLKQVIDAIQDGVFVLKDEKIILVNQTLLNTLGYEEDEVIGESFQSFVVEEHRELLSRRYLERQADQSPVNEYEVALHHASGVPMAMHLKIDKMVDARGAGYNVGTLYHVTPERELMSRLKQSEQEFKQIIQNLPDIFYRTDASGLITMASPYASQVLGYTMDELIGEPLSSFYADPEERAEALARIMAAKGAPTQVESHLKCKDGSTIWVSTSAYARFSSQGEFIGVEGIARNITDRKAMETQLREIALRDPLTQLTNRFGFDEQLASAINSARRQQSELAIIYIDLDNFRDVNNRFSYEIGDQLLLKFAQRLPSHFRDTDLVARIGGDEYAVLLDHSSDLTHLDELLARLRRRLRQPFNLGGEAIEVEFSMGHALYPQNGLNASELLAHADRLLQAHRKTSHSSD